MESELYKLYYAVCTAAKAQYHEYNYKYSNKSENEFRKICHCINQHLKSKITSSAPESALPTNSVLCPPPDTRHTFIACEYCRSSHRPHKRRPEATIGAQAHRRRDKFASMTRCG